MTKRHKEKLGACIEHLKGMYETLSVAENIIFPQFVDNDVSRSKMSDLCAAYVELGLRISAFHRATILMRDSKFHIANHSMPIDDFKNALRSEASRFKECVARVQALATGENAGFLHMERYSLQVMRLDALARLRNHTHRLMTDLLSVAERSWDDHATAIHRAYWSLAMREGWIFDAMSRTMGVPTWRLQAAAAEEEAMWRAVDRTFDDCLRAIEARSESKEMMELTFEPTNLEEEEEEDSQ